MARRECLTVIGAFLIIFERGTFSGSSYFSRILLTSPSVIIPTIFSFFKTAVAPSILLDISFIASLNLVLDFDFIEEASEMGVPKYMEWYSAFGLLVTLIWLYLEILRLLAKLQSRRN